jgi:hypothetical protein
MTNAKRTTRREASKTPKTTKRLTTKEPECIVEITKTDIYVVYGGVRIAKRGHPGTPQAKTWIPLGARR